MQPQTEGDYKQLLSSLIKKQIVILGPDITLAKARNVHGLTITDDGTVTQMQGNPQELIQALIEQFVELSGMIVKKTMEPLLANFPGLVDTLTAAAPAAVAASLIQPAQPANPVQAAPPATQPTPPGTPGQGQPGQ